MSIYNPKSVEQEAERADERRDVLERVGVIYGFDNIADGNDKVLEGLSGGRSLDEIRRTAVGDYAKEAGRFGFAGNRDGTAWVVETNAGELVVANVESVKQLSEDIRNLPSGYSIRDLLFVTKGNKRDPEIYKAATTLFKPEEKIAIADNALENMLCLGDARVAKTMTAFLEGSGEIFIVTPEDYQTFKSKYYPNRPESELLSSGGEIIRPRLYKYRQENGRAFTPEATIPVDDAQVIIVREQGIASRNQVVKTTARTGGKVSTKYKRQAKLETTRILTHELVHSTGIGSHLGNMQEMVTEFYAIRAQTLGEQVRGETSESLSMGYATATTMFSMLYQALVERENIDTKTLDRAFMWGESEDMQKTLAAITHMLGTENATKLGKGSFKSDAEAYIWLRDVLNPKQ